MFNRALDNRGVFLLRLIQVSPLRICVTLKIKPTIQNANIYFTQFIQPICLIFYERIFQGSCILS